MSELGGFVFDHQGAAKEFEGVLDLADMGAMVRVGELADGGFRNPQSICQGHLGHALRPHGGAEGQLGGHDGRQGHEVLSFGNGARGRNVAAFVNVTGQSDGQGVLGQRQSLLAGFAGGQGLGDIGEGDGQPTLLVRGQGAGVGVTHLEIPLLDLQLFEHGVKEAGRYLAALYCGEVLADVKPSVTALAMRGLEPAILSGFFGVSLGAFNEFCSVHVVIIALKGAIVNIEIAYKGAISGGAS